MGLNNFDIVLENPHGVYYPGSTIIGVVRITIVGEAKKVRGEFEMGQNWGGATPLSSKKETTLFFETWRRKKTNSAESKKERVLDAKEKNA
jgi:hypothetical protein